MTPIADRPRYDYARLVALIEGDQGGKAAPRRQAPKSPEAAGGRNNYFTSRAGQLRRLGYGEEEILAALRVENKNKGYDFPDRELATSSIGKIIMRRLKSLDKVAYVRFASVYLEFEDVTEFMTELKDLVRSRNSTSKPKRQKKH